MHRIHETIRSALTTRGYPPDTLIFSAPPNPEMGDIAIGCFALAKERGVTPAEAAMTLVSDLQQADLPLIASAAAAGPYVNVTLHDAPLATLLLDEQGDSFGSEQLGAGKTYVVEFACPNPLKAFHVGHLKNLITGESVVRILENAGVHVIRVNYQGDVGLHVAKALWGIYDWMDQFDAVRFASLKERVEFLGKAYAHGAAAFEESEEKKQDVLAYNTKVYARAAEIQDVYHTARQWSLEYFDGIYTRLGSHFDTLYFESDMFERGLEIVKEFVGRGVFKESDGAIIFEGSRYGLHDRVFVNSKGIPTYEAKDVALAEQHLQLSPDRIIHIVGKEQTQYFEVLFTALAQIFPESEGKETHVPGGFLQLKGDQKMSSRTGNIVTADALIDAIQEKIEHIMADSDIPDKASVIEAVTMAALKYAMLRANVSKDISFDIDESVSIAGDSGPYLLYLVARIKGILRKAEASEGAGDIPEVLAAEEKALLLEMAEYPVVTGKAFASYDASHIAQYLFSLAQAYNRFYGACPVLTAEGATRAFRLRLSRAVADMMEHGLGLLGIDTVEYM